MTEPVPSGPLAGLRVVELASEAGALAGKLLAELGAEVVLVEPPGGHRTRLFEPFVEDRPDPERSLWWWHHNTSKAGVVLDLEDPGGAEAFSRLAFSADVLLEAEPPGRLAALHVDYPDIASSDSQLVWASITSFGRESARSSAPVTDLTVLAGGGPLWSCGYDDHSIPPIRGGGGQAYSNGSVWAVNAILVALLARDTTGRGQLVDVSLVAAANVTTEGASVRWLVSRETVQRQTGRHAWPTPTQPKQYLAADGRYVNVSVPPRTGPGCDAIREWVEALGLREKLDDAVFLDIGAELEYIPLPEQTDDVVLQSVGGAMADALRIIAAHLDASEFTRGAQDRGITGIAIVSPEELLDDEHFQARDFHVPVFHDDLDRDIRYPGAPFRMSASPWRIRSRAPHLGEHDDLLA